ncbi:unnamed protein product, partial [marine sediment metagenome]
SLIRSLRPDVQEKLIAAQPGKKMGETQDIANAVLFLVSDEARFINGHCLHVDGGRSVGAAGF